MRRILINLVILSSVVVPAAARTVELTLHPAKAPEPGKKYCLLPKADEQSDTDAAPLYNKALQSLPDDLPMVEVVQWLKTPPDELPLKQIQSMLKRLEPALALLEQAAACKRCEWPYLDDGTLMGNLAKCRRLLFIHALKARCRIAEGRYDDAVNDAQTGFAMARHLGKDSSLIRGMVGIGVAAYICGQLEALIQRPDGPNLYRALDDFPKPPIDLTEQTKWEDAGIKEKVSLLTGRLGRHVAVLECIEAMRLYAAAHEGQFPEKLRDVTHVSVPDDPVTRKPFTYSRTGSKAVLEGPAPKGASPKEAFRYELNLKP
jgi:hypothetical protein